MVDHDQSSLSTSTSSTVRTPPSIASSSRTVRQPKSFPHSGDPLGDPIQRRPSPVEFADQPRRRSPTQRLGDAHPIRPVRPLPRISLDSPHVRAFERDTFGFGGDLNELGVVRERHVPSSYRPRAESPYPNNTLVEAESAPPLAHPVRTVAEPVQIPETPEFSSIMLHYGLAGNYLDEHNDRPPTVPPPRSSDPINFSPHRSYPSPSDSHRERLQRLDALRTLRPWDTPHDPHLTHVNAAALEASSRQGRIAPDDYRDFRSRIRRRLSDEVYQGESGVERWNRSVQEAMGRRVSGEPSIRRHDPYPRPRHSRLDEDIAFDTPGPYRQPTRPYHHWGEIPIDSTHTGLHDPFHPSMFSWREARRLSARSSDGGSVPNLTGDERMNQIGHPRLLDMAAFTADLGGAEWQRVFKSIAMGVSRWPAACRRKAAESTLEQTTWGQFGERPDMARDEHCSVCHDEYEAITKIAITACKHMYHRDCLDVGTPLGMHTDNVDLVTDP